MYFTKRDFRSISWIGAEAHRLRAKGGAPATCTKQISRERRRGDHHTTPHRSWTQLVPPTLRTATQTTDSYQAWTPSPSWGDGEGVEGLGGGGAWIYETPGDLPKSVARNARPTGAAQGHGAIFLLKQKPYGGYTDRPEPDSVGGIKIHVSFGKDKPNSTK